MAIDFNKDESGRSASMLPSGAILSHFRIIRILSSGRMGEVYLAQDIVLDRLVAMKLLPPWLAKNPEAKRSLLEEAKTASKLNHPNILTVYSVEEADGRIFMVTEYIDGKTLRDLIESGGLTPERIVKIGIEICHGLEGAHSAGVIHRDIKPQNILIDCDGHVKICDFGLATLKGAPESIAAGPSSGTLAYMSPEQTRGLDLDQRSDFFPLGVILYEMLTGTLPFKGDYEAALTYSIQCETPDPISDLRAETPTKLQNIIMKLLEKNRPDRYQNSGEIETDLLSVLKPGRGGKKRRFRGKTIAAVMAAAIFVVFILSLVYFFRFSGREHDRAMIAVLPFKNLGPSEDAYIAEGIAGELITNLAKGSEIGVISHTSALKYQDTDKSIAQIGRELDADFLIEGGLLWDKRKQPEALRLNAQLVRASDNSVLWAEKYQGDVDQIFRILADIADNVRSKVTSDTPGPQGYEPKSDPTDNLNAYDFYLLGNHYFYRSWDEQDVRIAIQMYEKAVDVDSAYTLAYAMLSRTHSVMFWEYYDRSEKRLTMARESADRALNLDPDLPEAHLALGMYYYSILDFNDALSEFSTAEKYQPDNSDLLTSIAGVKRRQGDFTGALEMYIRALKYDPRAHLKVFDTALTYSLLRKYPEAESYLNDAISIAPDWPLPYIYKAWLYILWTGDKPKAREALGRAAGIADLSRTEYYEYYWWLLRVLADNYEDILAKITPVPDSSSYYLHRARIYRLMSSPEKAAALYDSARTVLVARTQSDPSDPLFHSRLGIAYAGLGFKDQAIREGRMAVEILPVSRDAFNGQFLEANLAETYVMTGEYDAAVDILKKLLSFPGFTSIPYLKSDPIWKPLMVNQQYLRMVSD